MQDQDNPKHFRVIEAYQRSNDNPIVLQTGDPVKVIREFTDDPVWPDWLWCENAVGQAGWVPKSLIAVNGPVGTAREEYNARELSIEPEETLMIERILNGWAWARRNDGETGWVPLRHLQPECS